MPPVIPIYFQTASNTMPAISHPSDAPNTTTSTAPIIRKHRYPVPTLRLQLVDLSDDGASTFLSQIHPTDDIALQVQNVLNLLYTPSSTRPGTRSVTFILHKFPGVAYTTGIDLDKDHKEIHVNTQYVSTRKGNVRDELLGVICHELVHCFQWDAKGTTPGGLIEGIADWVRLRAGLAAAHWKQEAGGKWDGGYQHTGFFLEWLEQKFGDGTVTALNEGLRDGEYDEEKVFGPCCKGGKVQDLWKEYGEELEKKREEAGEEKPTGTGEESVVSTDTPPKFEGKGEEK